MVQQIVGDAVVAGVAVGGAGVVVVAVGGGVGDALLLGEVPGEVGL